MLSTSDECEFEKNIVPDFYQQPPVSVRLQIMQPLIVADILGSYVMLVYYA